MSDFHQSTIMACEVAMLNPQLDMTTPVAIAEGFYSPQHWSSSPEMSPNYANSPIAGSPNSCAAQSPTSYHSPMMNAVHSPPMVASLSPAHSPMGHHGSPRHIVVKQETDYACAVTAESHLTAAALYGKPAPPELVPSNVFGNVEGE